jgi:hypothetical protein
LKPLSRLFRKCKAGKQGCQIFLGTCYQKWKNVPNKPKMFQTVRKYPKCQQNIPNGPRLYQHFPI